MKKICLFIVPLVWLALGESAAAGTITCGNRPGTLTSNTPSAAVVCEMFNGNTALNETQVNNAYGDEGSWTQVSDLNPNLTDGPLTILFTNGTWGSAGGAANPVTGTWTIAPSFWSTYANAVLGFHVGHMGGSPTGFMFLIAPGETSGSFSYAGSGGIGFNDFKLFSAGEADAPAVPDGGATLALLGLALGGLGVIRRRFL